ncbi:hypothetical protein DFH09DRAFT_1028033 [Mycena vulgaris]|nr:hypothetical protein DFH09DRAFT_1028033 [Mycena vulgaris]
MFHSVKFYLPETFSSQRRSQITHGIERNGGERADTIHSATHIVTNSSRFHGCGDVTNVEIISDIWVDRSLILGQLLPCQFYSADPEKTFSGIVACASGISPTDLPHLEAGVKGLGGQWRHGLTKDVTHLFATSPNSDKFAAAMKHQGDTKIKVLLPHWFDDAVRLGYGKLLTAPYEWPDPKVLHPAPSEVEGKKEKTESSSRKLSDTKRAFYKTAIWNPDKAGQFPGPVEPLGEGVWGGRQVLLSPSLGLQGARRRVIEQAVEAAGGLILSYTSNNGDGDEDKAYDLVSTCDVFVTRWRAGQAFFKAFAEGKIVGTLNWLFYVHATGILSSPMDQLLHYPTRKVPIEDFSKQQITVTNYTGEARDYIKRLIHTMGGVFTPNMTGSNTVLIAAHMGGIKTTKALSWSIPIVNHTWLEDSFVSWRLITPALAKYIDFPPNLDFSPMLAERGVVINLDELGTEEEEDVIARAQLHERPPVGTEASAREVEGILDNGDIVMDDEDALETEEYLAPIRRVKSASERRVVSASISPTKHRATDEESMDVEPVTEPVKSSKRTRKPNGMEPQTKPTAAKTSTKGKEREKHQASVEEEEQEEETEAVRKAKAKGKGKEKQSKAHGKVMFAQETETDSADPSNARLLKKPSTRTTAGTSTSTKRKAQLMDSASKDDVTNAHQLYSPPPRKRAKPDKATEFDAASASAPENGNASSSSSKRKMTAGPGRDSAARKATRTESLRVLADERTSSAKSGTKKQPAISSSSEGRRSAGTKKTIPSETHDDADDSMPDVVNYELEARAQRSRDSSGKKREDLDSADEMPPPKPSKSKVKAGKKDAVANTSSESRAPRKSTTTIKMMTTTVVLADHVLKALSKLGVKPTTQISECTHLIAPSLVRTEKLLCALALGAFILSDKWATESVAANKLLPEKDYILNDKVNERKWNFRLVDAMARAKQVGGKLFENKTFYVTSKVPVEIKLLKNVVTAQGGKVSTQAPSVRTLNSAPGRYVISCPEDISIWRTLTKDHTIYSQELLLTAAVTQKIDWDNPAFIVPNSA